MAHTTFRTFPGFSDLDPTDPSSIDSLLTFHRATFGDTQMHNNNPAGGDDGSGDGGSGDGGDGGDGADGVDPPKKFTDPDTGKTWDFPADTAWKDMSADESTEYWRHKAQKHEKENEQLRRTKTTRRSQNDNAGTGSGSGSGSEGDDVDAEQIRQEERDTWAPRLVRAELKRFLPADLTDEQVEAIVAPINHSHFLTSDGEVATDKVKQYANSVSPGSTFPGTGQGRERGENSGRGSVTSAREDYVESRRKKR